MADFTLLERIAIWALPVIFAITVHEVAHGWVASKLGDNTAKSLGRLTLNPLSHIDLIGTIIVPGVLLFIGGFMFGWAKPVPVNWRNLNNPKRDMVYVAIAGPSANLLMAIAWALIIKMAPLLSVLNDNVVLAFTYMGHAGVLINVVLMVLNLLPLLPLDGGRVVAGLLPDKASYQYGKLERLGFPILVIIIAMGWLSKILGPPVYFLQTSILNMFGI